MVSDEISEYIVRITVAGINHGLNTGGEVSKIASRNHC